MAKREHFATINGKHVDSFDQGLKLLREEWTDWKSETVAKQLEKAQTKGKSYNPPPEVTMPPLGDGKA